MSLDACFSTKIQYISVLLDIEWESLMVFPILRQLHPGIARSINSLFSHLPWSRRFCGNPETVATFDEICMIFRCFSDCYLYSDFTVRWYHRCWVFVSSAVDCWVRESDVMFSLGLWAELLGSTYVEGGHKVWKLFAPIWRALAAHDVFHVDSGKVVCTLSQETHCNRIS